MYLVRVVGGEHLFEGVAAPMLRRVVDGGLVGQRRAHAQGVGVAGANLHNIFDELGDVVAVGVGACVDGFGLQRTFGFNLKTQRAEKRTWYCWSALSM